MPNITVVSPIRDGMPYLQRYRAQLAALDWPKDQLRRVVVEGDSVDDTAAQVAAWDDTEVITCTTGGRKYGSVIHPDRFINLSMVANRCLEAVDFRWTDYVFMLPVDIAYEPDLLQRLVAHDVPMVAPMVWIRLGDIYRFYDTWAFRQPEYRLSGFEQGSSDLGTGLWEMYSVGGANLIRMDVVQAGCRYSSGLVDVGLCIQAREQGFKVYADRDAWVYHGRAPYG